MAEVMLGNELHPDRVISVEKLYEILNEREIGSNFVAQLMIESNAFAVVRCKDCKHYEHGRCVGNEDICTGVKYWLYVKPDDFCSYGERRTDG